MLDGNDHPCQGDGVARRRLRRLSSVQVRNGAVVSLYLDLDPAQFALPRARLAEVESLADAARQQHTDAEEHRLLDLDSALARDVERVRRYLKDDFRPRGARGVAVFCSSAAGLFEALRLERPVRRRVFVSDRPCLRPLVAALPPPPKGEPAVVDDQQLLEAMRAGRGDGAEPVVTGLDATVGALNQRLMSILALPRDASADGLACAACSWLGRAPQAADACPIDGGRLEYVEDLYERMLGAALAQSADVRVLDDGALEAFGAAALLRFEP